jgi:soluble lytic murein transglycosylase-like protein
VISISENALIINDNLEISDLLAIMEEKMSARLSSENLTIAASPGWWNYALLLLGLIVILITAGCGGGRNSLRPTSDQSYYLDGEQGDSYTGELSAEHLQELYAKSGLKDRDHSLEKELRKWSHQSKIDFPIEMNKQVRAYIVYFATERKGFTARSLARSRRYLPMINNIFRQYGLPEDLAYLAMVESGFNPKARSPAGAAGMWQFIRSTGQRYGLVINRRVDERLNPEKSTRAAAHYLLDLYKQFGSWYLAAASYNCGERRVATELRKSNYKNFWQLSANKCIPGETRNYVPQMIAVTIIARNPGKFGFGNVPYQPPARPRAAPNLAVAQAFSPGPALSPPKPRSKPPQVRLASRSGPPPRSRGTVRQKSRQYARKLSKKADRRVCAVERHQRRNHKTYTRPTPYVASLFAYPHSHLKKKTARREKSISSRRVHRRAGPHKGKRSPALFARGHRSKPAHLAKKKGKHKKTRLSRSRRKTRVKAFLVSEAR